METTGLPGFHHVGDCFNPSKLTAVAPEKLLRALLLQVLYTIRSERQLMEQLDYNILYRWFVGLNLDDPVWVPTVFTKNRERLLRGHVADAFLAEVLAEAERRGLTQFYGDRMGTFHDPFGHVWSIATHVEDVPMEEMKKRAAEAFGQR